MKISDWERLARYEADKAKLSRAGLAPEEYERRIKVLVRKWGI